MIVDHSEKSRRRRVFQYYVRGRPNQIRSGNRDAVLRCILDDLRHLDVHVMGYVLHMPNAVHCDQRGNAILRRLDGKGSSREEAGCGPLCPVFLSMTCSKVRSW